MKRSGWTADTTKFKQSQIPEFFLASIHSSLNVIVMAMETALLNCSVQEVIQLLKGMLKKQGYEIEKIDLNETIVLAYRDGRWFSQKQHVLFQISTMDEEHTRVDVTATIDGNTGSEEEEEVLEEKIVSSIYHYKP